MGVFLWATLLCGYDVCFRKLPNWLTIPGACVAAYWFPASVIGGLAWALLYLRKGIGGGDAKLALSLGTVALASGIEQLVLAVVLASLLTVAICLVLKSSSAPHGPSMLLGTWCAVALGPPMNTTFA